MQPSHWKKGLYRLALVLGGMFSWRQPVLCQEMQGFDATSKLAPDFQLTPFYENVPEPVGKRPGDILRTEVVGAPEGSLAWRVLYVSRTWDDKPVPVSGLIIVPKGKPAKPRTVLTWTHGTTGGARNCAPSLAPQPAQELVQRSETAPIDYGVPYLKDLLARGMVVVATDYQGQGAPGVHQYLVGNTAGRNALDIVRAARNLETTGAGPEFLTLGWSQGGHAGLFTGEEQPGYAAELRHLGAAVIAPASTAGLEPVNIPHLYILASGYRAAYKLALDEFTEEGKKLVAIAGEVSVNRVFRSSLTMKGPFAGPKWSDAFAQALERNIPGKRKSAAPILVVQGMADNVVSPEGTRALLPRAVASRNTLHVSWYQGKGHRDVIEPARAEILGWFDDRLQGKPVPEDRP